LAFRTDDGAARPIHALHAVLLAGALPLFLGGLLSDWAYVHGYEVQWTNFAQWLIAGAMVFTGFALLWSVIEVVGRRASRGWRLACLLLLLGLFVTGLIDSFVHTQDAYGSMPTGLILSAVNTVLAVLAIWVGFSSLRRGEAA
jgi:uncharacterized membrane protein